MNNHNEIPIEPWWEKSSGSQIAQGDIVRECLVPIVPPNYGEQLGAISVPCQIYDCIVVTQSCDLQNNKAPLIALCAIYSIQDSQDTFSMRTKKDWNAILKGKHEGLFMLASTSNPQDNSTCYVANFRQLFSLPQEYVRTHISKQSERYRLKPPYLEHFSQAFAKFFMRVGLPTPIPEFK
jgi:hypothetical protein